MVSCGEASGDLYAGALAQALQAQAPGTRVIGFGGERLAASGAELAGDYRGIAVTGLTEVLRVLPRTYAMYRRLVDLARTDASRRLCRDRFPRLQFPPRRCGPRAWHPGGLLRQPAIVGVASRPHPRIEGVCRQGAADLPVRSGDLRARRRAGGVCRTPAHRPDRRHARRATLFFAAWGSTRPRRWSPCSQAADRTKCARCCRCWPMP